MEDKGDHPAASSQVQEPGKSEDKGGSAQATPASLELDCFLDFGRSSTDGLAGGPGEVVRGALPQRVQGDEHAKGGVALQHGRDAVRWPSMATQ